jgi:uncharacterized RDD family membrane protein YckC
MTWQGSGGPGAPGDPDDDATRVDNPVPAVSPPFTAPAEPADPEAAPPPGGPPAAPPAAPISSGLPPAPGPQSPAPWAAPTAGAWAAVPPGSDQLAVPGAPGLVYGGATPRFVAYLVDAVLLGIVGSIISAPFTATAFNEALANPSAFDPANPTQFGQVGITTIIALILNALYFTFFWSSGGRATIGMRIMKLQIGDATTGNRIPIATAFRRWLAFADWLNLLAFIPFIAGAASFAVLAWQLILLITTATHPQRQGLHDRFANTAMVRPINAGSGGYVVGCIVVVVAIVLLSFVALIFLGSQMSSILSAVGESV